MYFVEKAIKMKVRKHTRFHNPNRPARLQLIQEPDFYEADGPCIRARMRTLDRILKKEYKNSPLDCISRILNKSRNGKEI